MVEHREYSQYFINIPGLLPPKSHGRRSLEGYSPGCQKESDMTEQLSIHTHTHTHKDGA